MKCCKDCKKEKPLSEFYNTGYQGHLRNDCKTCYMVVVKKYDKKNLEQKRKRAREYEQRKRLKTLNL